MKPIIPRAIGLNSIATVLLRKGVNFEQKEARDAVNFYVYFCIYSPISEFALILRFL